MRLVPERRAVVLRLRNPARLLKALPTARAMGKPGYVAIPHELDETKFLNNLGIRVPAPILHHYAWPCQFTPFDAQRQTAAMLTMHSRAFVLNEIGTGKSLSVLWAYDYLRLQGKAKALLVIAPLSTLERTWADEVFTHLTHLRYSVVYGSKAQRRRALQAEADVYIINHDGVAVVLDELCQHDRITHVAVDELAQVARNARTRRWKTLDQLINKRKRPLACWGMTGTPTPNAPTDAWAQSKLITPGKAPRSFTKFRDMTMYQRGPYTWVEKEDAIETVRSRLVPATRYTRDECIDLPDCMYETRVAQLTTEQDAAYKAMAAKLKAEINAQEVLAVNEAVKVSKLIQIACGAAYDVDRNEVAIPNHHRHDVLLEVIQATRHKVIVYVPYIAPLLVVDEFLRSQGITTGVVYGAVKTSERDRIFRAFQRADSPRVLVAQPAAISHGLTLTAASTIVWFAPTTSNDIYEQANGRITRPGQRNTQHIIHLEGTHIEHKTYERLKKKQRMQGILLDAVKASRLT